MQLEDRVALVTGAASGIWAALRQMYRQDSGGSIIYMASVNSKECSENC